MKGKNERKENGISRSKWKGTEVDIEMLGAARSGAHFFPLRFSLRPLLVVRSKSPYFLTLGTS